MKPKHLHIASLVVASLVILTEIPWLAKSDLAIMIIGVAAAVALNAIAGLMKSGKPPKEKTP